jgi:hypothetical protein
MCAIHLSIIVLTKFFELLLQRLEERKKEKSVAKCSSPLESILDPIDRSAEKRSGTKLNVLAIHARIYQSLDYPRLPKNRIKYRICCTRETI